MVVGTFCVAIPMVLNGAIGAKLHIRFSVIVRSSFGYYFGYFCIISRAVLAMFWLGIQGANGAHTLSVVWPPKGHVVPRTVYGIPQDEEGAKAYDTQFGQKVVRKESLVGDPKSFANVGGIDTIGATRKNVDETARASVEYRKASVAAQGGQYVVPDKEVKGSLAELCIRSLCGGLSEPMSTALMPTGSSTSASD